MRIGELAAELGLNPRTIRYYETIGCCPARGAPARATGSTVCRTRAGSGSLKPRSGLG
jgi:hypothetical protein